MWSAEAKLLQAVTFAKALLSHSTWGGCPTACGGMRLGQALGSKHQAQKRPPIPNRNNLAPGFRFSALRNQESAIRTLNSPSPLHQSTPQHDSLALSGLATQPDS